RGVGRSSEDSAAVDARVLGAGVVDAEQAYRLAAVDEAVPLDVEPGRMRAARRRSTVGGRPAAGPRGRPAAVSRAPAARAAAARARAAAAPRTAAGRRRGRLGAGVDGRRARAPEGAALPEGE